MFDCRCGQEMAIPLCALTSEISVEISAALGNIRTILHRESIRRLDVESRGHRFSIVHHEVLTRHSLSTLFLLPVVGSGHHEYERFADALCDNNRRSHATQRPSEKKSDVE